MKHGLEHEKPEDVTQEDLPEGVILRDHVVDGIREYDQRLPSWWLVILYSAIAFSIIYWVVIDDRSHNGGKDASLDAKLAELNTKKLASSIDVTNDDLFWEMASNPTFIAAGKENFETNCVACHGANLQGGIGFNLVDEEWIHGSTPSEVYVSVANGFPEKGMQEWEPLLGQKRIAEIVAYVLSKNSNLKPN
jgi:cytochrome c oxidase cbb3-type subunit 3